MDNGGQEYNIRAVRALLTRAFSPQSLRRFCKDRNPLRDICSEFSPADGLNDMVDEVIAYCERYRLFDYLLEEVELVNPKQYAFFEADLRAPAEQPPDTDQAQGRVEQTNPAPRVYLKDWLGVAASVATVLALIVAILAFGRDILDWTWLPGSMPATPTEEMVAIHTPTPALCPKPGDPPLPARPPFFSVTFDRTLTIAQLELALSARIG